MLTPHKFAHLLKSNEYETLVTELFNVSTNASEEEIYAILSAFDEIIATAGWTTRMGINPRFGGLYFQPIKERLTKYLYVYANYSVLEKKAKENGRLMKESSEHYKYHILVVLENLSVT